MSGSTACSPEAIVAALSVLPRDTLKGEYTKFSNAAAEVWVDSEEEEDLLPNIASALATAVQVRDKNEEQRSVLALMLHGKRATIHYVANSGDNDGTKTQCLEDLWSTVQAVARKARHSPRRRPSM
ncbi:unnamed protein product [Cyclocybe aegerita]|uniref:Uncharacterized protein n=1 Tax=Cyclocybe aegerita TaxID=1973307 RepID=A0A8S0XD30_CYCAE|nr:unnamed protein product [Cyclocybe aegerita]